MTALRRTLPVGASVIPTFSPAFGLSVGLSVFLPYMRQCNVIAFRTWVLSLSEHKGEERLKNGASILFYLNALSGPMSCSPVCTVRPSASTLLPFLRLCSCVLFTCFPVGYYPVLNQPLAAFFLLLAKVKEWDRHEFVITDTSLSPMLSRKKGLRIRDQRLKCSWSSVGKTDPQVFRLWRYG